MPTITDLLSAATLLLITLYLYITRHSFKYFRRRGIPDLNPTFPFGNGLQILTASRQLSLVYKDFYDRLKTTKARYGGFFVFTQPNLLILDPEVIRSVLVKDFGKFSDRGIYDNEADDPLGTNMFSMEGQKWKDMRTKLSPTFTSGKMKGMFEVVLKCAAPMVQYLDGFVRRNEAVDLKHVFSLYTVDSIGSCAFGLDCNCFGNGRNDFYDYGVKVANPPFLMTLKNVFIITFPELALKLHMKTIEDEVESFYYKVFNETMCYRKQTNALRKDFMQILLTLIDDGAITYDQAVSQAFLFLVAGFETSATTGTFVMFELAQHKDIQDKVRDEIMKITENHNGEITYESIQEMKYLGQVFDETLRKYPPLGFLNRIAVSDYKIPETDIVLQKGSRIVIPTYALQHDPEYFPEPQKFDPERFNEDNKRNIKPFTYLPFGDGPRNCIGMRFAWMQTKVGLVKLLQNYEFKLNGKTKIPVEFDEPKFLLQVKGGVWLDVNRVEMP